MGFHRHVDGLDEVIVSQILFAQTDLPTMCKSD